MRYGGAASFENVEVQYETGKRATLTIYHDGEVLENVDLQSIETEAEMIQTMIDKGFRMKPEDQVVSIRHIGKEAQKREENERNDRMEEQKRRMEEYMKNKARARKEAAGEL